MITGPGGVLGDYLVQDPRTSLVTLTGETNTGKHVAQKAAANLKKYTLELGGKDPLVVCDDADLNYAVDVAAFGGWTFGKHIKSPPEAGKRRFGS